MNTNEIKMEWTRINEKDRVRMGITRDDYALCRYVDYRGKDLRKNTEGWCNDSKSEIADFVGISRVHLYRSIDRLQTLGLLKSNTKGDLSTTKLWADGGVKCNIMLHFTPKQSVTLCYTNCNIMLHFAPFKCNIMLHTPYKRDSKIEKLDIAQSNDCFEGKNISSTKGNVRGETSLGARLPKASDVAQYSFAEFWGDYGFKRGSKSNAQKKWDRLTAEEIGAIRATLEIYKRETVTEDGKRGDKFKPMRKHPEFFLAAKTWEAYSEQAKEEANRPKDEWDEPYQRYVSWVMKNYPNIAKTASYLTKQQYVCHKTTPYVKDMIYIGEHNIQNMLIRAHDAFEKGLPKASQCGSVFNYQVHLLEERVKSRTA